MKEKLKVRASFLQSFEKTSQGDEKSSIVKERRQNLLQNQG